MRARQQQLKDLYQIIGKVGSGTYGEVHKARVKADPSRLVSVKQTKNVNEDKAIPSAVLRELMLLSEINFPHIIHTSTKDVFYDPETRIFSFVYDYGAFDVRKLIRYYAKKRQTVSEIVTKSILFQLLLGLEHIHERGIIHCDVTPPNLIIMPQNSKLPGILKLIDFGLARAVDSPDQDKFTGVVTVWYRAPELLLGDTRYNSAIDVWSAGCIFAELLLGSVLFQAETQQFEQNPTAFNRNQMNKIIEVMGPLREDEDIARPQFCTHLQEYNQYPKSRQRTTLRQMFQNVPLLALDLLEKMLTLNPLRRITAHDALRHDYFNEKPIPAMNIARMIPPDDWETLLKIGEGTNPN